MKVLRTLRLPVYLGATTLALLGAFARPAFSQHDQAETTPALSGIREDHADQAAKWFEDFTNPSHDPNYLENKLKGFEQLRQMAHDPKYWSINGPALKSASAPAWIMAGISQVPRGSQNSWVSGRGQCVAESADGSIYYGAPISGLWKTTDRGGSWIPLSDNWATPIIGAVAVDPVHPSTVYAGTGCANGSLYGGGTLTGVGIYKSIDAGLNWTLALNQSGIVTCGIIVNPVNTRLVYAATTAGVTLSTDAGTTWNSVVSISGITSMVLDPVDPSILYVAGANQIQKSTDSGKTWTKLKGFPSTSSTMTIAMTPKNHLYVYLSSAMGGGVGNGSTLSRTTDGGTTWKILTDTLRYLGDQGYYANSLAVDPNNADNAIVGGLDIYSISNAGASTKKLTDWTTASSNSNFTHADIHSLVYINDTLYTLSDGGIYYSTSNGTSWNTSLNKNLPTLQFVGGDAHLDSKGNPTTFVAGAQDNGLNQIAPLQQYWTYLHGGDGGICYISQDGKIIYGTYIYYTLYKSIDGGNSWVHGPGYGVPGENWDNLLVGSKVTTSEFGSFYMQYDVADDDPNVVALVAPDTKSRWNLWLTTDGFLSPPNDIVAIAGPSSANAVQGSINYVSFAGSNTLFISTSSNNLYHSEDQGGTWTKASTALGGKPTSICTKPWQSLDANVYMSVAGSVHFLHSTDGGDTWSNPATNLPNLNYVTVAASDKVIFLGHDFGVLYSTDAGVTWYPLDNGLPQTQIMKLKVRGHYLIATTYGRNMYYIDINQLGGSGVAAINSAEPTAAITAVYPNPVESQSPHSSIRFTMASDAHATIGVYDVLGREEHLLLNESLTKGEHECAADLSGLPAGQHFIMLTTGGVSVMKPISIE